MNTHSLSRLVPALPLLTSVVAGGALGQSRASLGLGVSTARYSGGSSLSSAALSPAFEFGAPSVSLTTAGTFASLPLGVWSSQGRADVWAATPPALGGLRFAVEAIGAGTARTDGGWTAAAHGVAELLWDGRTWGVALGAGPSDGWIAGQPSVAALHTRARAWWQVGSLNYAVSVEPTHFLGAWFTDASAGVTATTGPVVSSLWAVGRMSRAYGSKAGGGAALQFFPVPHAAIELGAGSYLPDPYQGLPRAGYVTAGIRLFATRRSAPRPATAPTWPPLTPERRSDSVAVRFRMDDAKSVAIAGDWDGWQPRPLHPLGGALWEGALALPPGTYHFTLLVDDSEWVVPGGVAVVGDGAGGMVGVLTVR
jgi:AMP-activated protein kinase-like protein